jgi:hypothetical protein
MVSKTYYVSRLKEAIDLLDSSDAGQLQHQAKQLFKQQLHAGLATRLQPSFKQTDVEAILNSVEETLADKSLLAQFTHTVHCGGVYAARAALESCLAAVQESEDACRIDRLKVSLQYAAFTVH